MRDKLLLILGILLLLVFAAGYVRRRACGPFPDWKSSPYVLPYPAGLDYIVDQANCSNGGHQGIYKYSYDFLMPVGTLVTAARGGTVGRTETRYENGDLTTGHENWVQIRHEDGTFAVYSHLSPDGALVKAGQRVRAGDPVGFSGNTGHTGNRPHLHFHLSPCPSESKCGTLPVTFRNTDPNPSGLLPKRSYLAEPFLAGKS